MKIALIEFGNFGNSEGLYTFLHQSLSKCCLARCDGSLSYLNRSHFDGSRFGNASDMVLPVLRRLF